MDTLLTHYCFRSRDIEEKIYDEQLINRIIVFKNEGSRKKGTLATLEHSKMDFSFLHWSLLFVTETYFAPLFVIRFKNLMLMLIVSTISFYIFIDVLYIKKLPVVFGKNTISNTHNI